jgi:hypothetical protein
MASGTAASVKLYATGLQRPRVLTLAGGSDAGSSAYEPSITARARRLIRSAFARSMRREPQPPKCGHGDGRKVNSARELRFQRPPILRHHHLARRRLPQNVSRDLVPYRKDATTALAFPFNNCFRFLAGPPFDPTGSIGPFCTCHRRSGVGAQGLKSSVI